MQPAKRRRIESADGVVITAVLDSALTSATVPLRPWNALNCTSGRQLSQILTPLKAVNKSNPATMLKMSHLKLIRKVGESSWQILLYPVDEEAGEVAELLSEASEVVQVQVPARPPLTRRQFEHARQHWPCLFREHKSVEAALADRLFTADERAHVRAHLAEARRAANESGRSNGCVVVSPEKPAEALVVAVGSDRLLEHAAMAAVEAVARISRRLAADGLESHYLCNGYDCFLTSEPCAMCAAALLHSRIGRVFYELRRDDGALGSHHSLHNHPFLNHHFDVYHVQPDDSAARPDKAN